MTTRLLGRLGITAFAAAALLGTLSAPAQADGRFPPSAEAIVKAAGQRLNLKACRVVPVLSTIDLAGLGGSSATTGVLAVELTPGVLTTFTLEPYALRTPDFKFVVSDETGDHVLPPELTPAPTTYKGVSLQGDEVYASIYDGGVSAFVVPAHDPANVVFIQPVRQDAEALNDPALDATLLHAVYSSADVLPTEHTCGVDHDCCVGGGHDHEAAPTSAPSGFTPRGVVTCRYIRMNVDADFPMYAASGRDIRVAAANIESVMLGVNQVYHSTVFTGAVAGDVRFTVPTITVRTNATTEPYASLPTVDTDAGALLTLFNSTWPNSTATRDMSHLFTGREIAGSTIGLAYVNALCSTAATGFSQTYFTSNLNQRIQLTAHEIGHNFGMNHDLDGSLHVMAPSVGNPANLTFSSASISSAVSQLNAKPTCMVTPRPDVQADAASTRKNIAVRVDVLANDGRAGLACPTTVTSFTLPSGASSLGGTVSVSTGTGPGGRNEVLYTPPSNQEGVLDTFNYSAAGASVPVTVQIRAPRPADGPAGQTPGLNAVYYDTRPNFAPNNWWVYDVPPTDMATLPVLDTRTFTQINFTGNLPSFPRGAGAIITGYVNVPTASTWTFSLAAGTSARLSLGGEVLLVAPGASSGAAATATALLGAGVHAIKVEYHYGPNNPGPKLILGYGAEGQPVVPIPASAFFKQIGSPPVCVADFSLNGTVDIDDIFIFLNAWFAGDIRCDVTNSNGVTIDDIFVYLNIWFAGCP